MTATWSTASTEKPSDTPFTCSIFMVLYRFRPRTEVPREMYRRWLLLHGSSRWIHLLLWGRPGAAHPVRTRNMRHTLSERTCRDVRYVTSPGPSLREPNPLGWLPKCVHRRVAPDTAVPSVAPIILMHNDPRPPPCSSGAC